MAAQTTEYLSNPIDMIKPSTRAIGLNAGTLLALIGIQLLPLVFLFVAMIIGVVDRSGSTSIIALVLGFASIVAVVAIAFLILPAFTLVLMASAKSEKLKARPALSQARPFVLRSIGIGILTGLAVLGGFLLFIIPGFIFMAWFSLSSYVLVTENLGIVDSMKRSRALVRGRVWEIWGLNSLSLAVSIIPVFGSTANFILSVLMIPALPIRYLQLAATKPEDRPKVHWVNYALIVLAILAGGLAANTTKQDLQDLNSAEYTNATYGI